MQLLLRILFYTICFWFLRNTGEARAKLLRIRLENLGNWWKQLGRLFLLLLAEQEIQSLLITDEVYRVGRNH